MKKIVLLIGVGLLVLAASSSLFSTEEQDIARILEQSTVKVFIYDVINGGKQYVGHGSGFLFHMDKSKGALIGTNFHVIRNLVYDHDYMVEIGFENNNSKVKANVIEYDELNDFAVLSIPANALNTIAKISPLKIGVSKDVKRLDDVYLAGYPGISGPISPFGGAFKIQKGYINSFQTHSTNKQDYFDLSIIIDKGDSGGPLVDKKGNLIGIPYAFQGTFNLAIKVDNVRKVIDGSIGKLKSGALQTADVPKDYLNPFPVAIQGYEIEPNNNKFNSNLLLIGLTISGKLNEMDSEDWFEIGGQEGTNPKITITHNADANFDLEVYNFNNFTKKKDLVGSTGGTGPVDSVQCKVPEMCFIKVYRKSGFGDYTISIDPGKMQNSDFIGAALGVQIYSNEIEPNNNSLQANFLPSGYLATGNLDEYDTVDWFELGQHVGTNPTLSISHGPGCNFDFEVYNYNEFSKAANLVGKATGTGAVDSIKCQVPNVCFVKVWKVSGAGNYMLKVDP